MGMRISSAGSANQTTSASAWQQRSQSIKNLMSSLQSGDLAGAQQAFSGLSTAGATLGNSPLGQIRQALQSGNLSGAQQIAQQMQASHSGHHHGGHGAKGAPEAGATAPATAGTGTMINTAA